MLRALLLEQQPLAMCGSLNENQLKLRLVKNSESQSHSSHVAHGYSARQYGRETFSSLQKDLWSSACCRILLQGLLEEKYICRWFKGIVGRNR